MSEPVERIKTAEERLAVDGAYSHSDVVLNTVTVSFAKYAAMLDEVSELRAAYEAQRNEVERLKAKVECLEGKIELEQAKLRGEEETVRRVVAHSEALKAENEAQAKRLAELEQKEIVLDRLIAKFEGKHEFVGKKLVHKETPLDLGEMENAATVCAEHVSVYQWVLRADGERSFKQAVMNLLAASKNGDSK